MILANSADSHLLEPAISGPIGSPHGSPERAPRSEKTEKYETIYLDGERMYRALARSRGDTPARATD